MEENRMILNISTVESEKAKNDKFASDNGITQEEMDEVYQEIFENLPDNVTGDNRIKRALRKTRGALKKKINVQGVELDGFIVMRFRNNDFERNAWNKVDKFVQDKGIDEAKAKGFVNANGDYIHSSLTTSFSNQQGKVIDKDNVRGSAIAIVTNKDNKNELRWLNIGKFNVFEKIPLCREVQLIVKEGNQAGPLYPDRNAYFLNGVKLTQGNAYYSDEEFQAYANLIEKLCGDIAYYTKEEIDEYAKQNTNNRNNFIAVPVSSVSKLGNAIDNGSVPIEFELDDAQITAWADRDIFRDLTIEEGIQGIAMLNTYVNSEGNAGYRIGGFIPLM